MILAQTSDAAAAGGSIIFLLIQLVIGLAVLAFGIYCIIDSTKFDEATYAAAGQQKQTVLIITIVGVLCCIVASLYYWFGIRPKLQAAQSGGAVGGYAG